MTEQQRTYLGTYTDYVAEDLNGPDVYVLRFYDSSMDHFHFFINKGEVDPKALPKDVYGHFKGILKSKYDTDIEKVRPIAIRPFRGIGVIGMHPKIGNTSKSVEET